MNKIVISGLLAIFLSSAGYFYFSANNRAPESLSVKLAPAQQGPFTASVSAPGVLIARKKETLASPIAGIVRDHGFSAGLFLRKGTIIASVTLLENEMLQKQQALEFARIDLEILEQHLQQSQELLQAKAISENEFNGLKIRKYKQEKLVENLRRELEFRPVETTFDGMLVEKKFQHGDRIASGTVLCMIVDTASFVVEIDVPQHLMAKIFPGQKVEYTAQIFPGTRYGKVLEIGQVAKQASHQYGIGSSTPPEFTVVASIQRSRSDNFLLGSKIDAHFILQQRSSAVFVPQEAVLFREDTTIVFLSRRGIARKQQVVLGLSNDQFIEILAGVAYGDTIVTVGNLDVQDGIGIQEIGKDTKDDYQKSANRTFLLPP